MFNSTSGQAPLSQRYDFPLTKFLCDVIRMDMGKLTKAQIRAKWQAKEYHGVNPDYAKWIMGS